MFKDDGYSLGFRIWDSCFGFRVSGFGFRGQEFGFRVWASGSRSTAFMVQDFGLRVQGVEFRVSSIGFRISGCGLRAAGFRAHLRLYALSLAGDGHERRVLAAGRQHQPVVSQPQQKVARRFWLCP